jgi:hypothetical protein
MKQGRTKAIFFRAYPADLKLLKELQAQTQLGTSEIMRKSLHIGGPLFAKAITKLMPKGTAA